MSSLWTDMAMWWMRLAVAGALFLLAGVLLLIACRRPATRLHVGGWILGISILLVPFTFLPAWLEVPIAIESEPFATSAPVSNPSPNATSAVEQAIGPNDETERFAEPVPDLDEGAVAAGFSTAPDRVLTQTVDAAAHLHASREPVAGIVQTQGSPALPWIVNGLLLAYWLIVFALLARLALGQWRLMRLWRAGTDAAPCIRQALERLCAGLSVPAVRVSGQISGPICFGVLRSRILIPTALANPVGGRALDWILAHELSHLRRRDPLVGWICGLAQSLFFFVPWFWKLRRDVRLNQEFLADAAAANQPESSGSAADYADFLVRLTCTGRLPIGAAGVKSPSSDLYRRVTMLLQNTNDRESRSPRRWSLLLGCGLLVMGIGLAGMQFSARDAAAQPAKEGDAPKKPSISDVEDEIRRALESLKNGPEPKKEEKPPVDLNPVDAARRAQEALKKAQEELRKNPTSDEAKRAYEEAQKKVQESARNRQPALPQGIPEFPNFPQFPQLQPLNPEDFDKEVELFNQQLQKIMEEFNRQMQQGGMFPNNGRNPFGGIRGFNRRLGEGRLGVRVDAPTPILSEQLDLPAGKGMVVIDVIPDSTAAKAGIRINDILLEIGGKELSGTVLDLQRLLREFKPDEKVDIVLLRKGKKETLKDIALPEARAEQFNPFAPRLVFPPLPNNPRFPNGFPPEFFGNGASTAMSVQVVNGDYTIKYQEDGVKFTIQGYKDDGGIVPTSIEVDDNGKMSKATSVDKLDEAYRPMVEKVLKRVR